MKLEEEKHYFQSLPPLLVCDGDDKGVVVADMLRVGGIQDFGDAAILEDRIGGEVEVARVKYLTDHVQM